MQFEVNLGTSKSWLGLPVYVNPLLAADDIFWHKTEPQYLEVGSMDAGRRLCERLNSYGTEFREGAD